MQYSEIVIDRLMSADELSTEEEICVNILNFIRTIQHNQLDFISTEYDSQYFGELPMTFRKEAGQVFGMITATVEGHVKKYVFNERGYESMDDLERLIEY
ncbi:hypothetical protein ACTWQB_11900 [Piscibacillus sp. B03]|uniref:hypothetical protein n=1 Tax=Piscibacillus sp. B03 TaxID=3457430 RepID=UPI003FCD2D7C